MNFYVYIVAYNNQTGIGAPEEIGAFKNRHHADTFADSVGRTLRDGILVMVLGGQVFTSTVTPVKLKS